MNGVEAQDNTVARPGLRNHKFPDHRDGLVLWHVKTLLEPLAGDFEERPAGAVQRAGAGRIGGRGINGPSAVEEKAILIQPRRLYRQRAEMHRLEEQVGGAQTAGLRLPVVSGGENKPAFDGNAFNLLPIEAEDALGTRRCDWTVCLAASPGEHLRADDWIIGHVQHLPLQARWQARDSPEPKPAYRRLIRPQFNNRHGGVHLALNLPRQCQIG